MRPKQSILTGGMVWNQETGVGGASATGWATYSDLRAHFELAEIGSLHYRGLNGKVLLRPLTMNKNEILIDLSESEMTKVGKEEFAKQSFPQKVFTAIWEVESEVNNGGLSQNFLNDSAESASFLVAALEKIGAPKTANICQRAIAIAFPGGLAQTVESIRSAASSFSTEILGELETLDQEFFSYPHNLTDLLFEFVKMHTEEFGRIPRPEDEP